VTILLLGGMREEKKMSEKRYVVELDEGEREELKGIIGARSMSVEKRIRAQVLLMVDQGQRARSGPTSRRPRPTVVE